MAARAPNDVPCGLHSCRLCCVVTQMFAGLLRSSIRSGPAPCEPGVLPTCQTRVPIAVGPDPQRFEIPTIFAVVRRCQLSPQPSTVGFSDVPQCDRTLAAHFGRRIVDELVDGFGHVATDPSG